MKFKSKMLIAFAVAAMSGLAHGELCPGDPLCNALVRPVQQHREDCMQEIYRAEQTSGNTDFSIAAEGNIIAEIMGQRIQQRFSAEYGLPRLQRDLYSGSQWGTMGPRFDQQRLAVRVTHPAEGRNEAYYDRQFHRCFQRSLSRFQRSFRTPAFTLAEGGGAEYYEIIPINATRRAIGRTEFDEGEMVAEEDD